MGYFGMDYYMQYGYNSGLNATAPGCVNGYPVPGYGVTELPVNFSAFNSLSNGAITNFGGATQYVTYPEGHSSMEYEIARNSSFWAETNPLLLGICSPSVTGFPSSQVSMQSAYDLGYAMMEQQYIQGIASALNSIESGFASLLKNDNLTNAQKAKVQGIIDDAKALKSKFEKQLKDRQPTVDDVKAMQKEVEALQKRAGEIVESMRAANSGEAGSAGSTNGGKAADETAEEEISAKKQHEETLLSMNEVCDALNDAIAGPGTNYDADEKGMFNILSNEVLVNENNIVELFEQWEKKYAKHGDYKDDKGGFIETLMDECEFGQKEQVASIIINLLEKRANKLGIDVTNEVGAARTAMKPNWIGWSDSDKIVAAVNALYDKVKKANDNNIKETDKKSEAKKAENKKEISQKKSQVVTEKKNELALFLKEELELKNIPQLSAGIKVETDENGEFTGYSFDANTPNGKVTLKGITAHELVRAIERQGLKAEDLVRKSVA